MPIYEISTEGEETKRLVKATSAPAAISHCARGRYSARTISNVEDASDLFNAGVKLEIAGEKPGEPESGKPKDD
jgi:hypothetical protein